MTNIKHSNNPSSKVSTTKSIFFVIYAGFSSRYLLQTDIFKGLLGLDYKIVILSPNANDEKFQEDYENHNVTFELFEDSAIQKIQKGKLYKLFANTRSLTLPKKYGIDTLIEKEKILKAQLNSKPIILFIFGYFYIALARILRSFSIARKIFIAIENFIYKKQLHSEVFGRYRPEMLVIADLGTLDKSNFILREARAQRVPIVSIILSWDNLTSKGMGAVKPDFAVAWNENMRYELVHYHDIPINRCFIGGVAHFDIYHKNPSMLLSERDLRVQLGINNTKKIIVFGSSSPSSFKENIRITALLLKHIRDGDFSRELHLVVRLHPAYITRMREPHVISDMDELSKLKDRYPDSLTINKPVMKPRDFGYELPLKDMILIGSLFKHSSVLVTQFSTLMLEAAIFDLPIVNVGFDNFRGSSMKSYQIAERTHLKRILDTGFTRTAKLEEDLLVEINRYLEDPRLENKERAEIRLHEGGPNKGKAGTAIADHIHSLLCNNND